MALREPASFREVAALVAPILRAAADIDVRAVMAELILNSKIDLADEPRLLQMLTVDGGWASRREALAHFDEALRLARSIRARGNLL